MKRNILFKKVIALSTTVAFLTLSVFSVFAADIKPSFSTTPTAEDLKLMKPTPIEQKKAWMTDLKGNITNVAPVTFPQKQQGGISTQWIDGQFVYQWSYYDDRNRTVDDYHFLTGAVEAVNKTSSTIQLKYTQQNTNTVAWTYTGKVAAEGEFGNALIAKLKVQTGFDIQRQSTEYSSSTIEFGPINIPVGQKGRIAKYKKGIYSSGYGCWKVYRWQSGAFVGYYNESGSAWTVDNITDIFRAWTGMP